jgi:hypothetical protein
MDNSFLKYRIWVCLLSFFVLFFTACREEEQDGPFVKSEPSIPFSTVGNYLGVWNGASYSPIFLKGMNLGTGVPGTQPGELAITTDQYSRWLSKMSDMGINSLRIYTLHFPRFYEAVYNFNISHPNNPIYILHGIWLDETNPSQDLYNLTQQLQTEIAEVVDSVHGQATIGSRFGKAFGIYTVDISKWVIGWVIGREIFPEEITTTDQNHPLDLSYSGQTLRISDVNPSTVWAATQLDYLISYEKSTYGRQRPVSISSWPTLDPLSHPTELENTKEDLYSLGLAGIDMYNAPAGYFASYHAYPYYPDFMNEDPGYTDYSDVSGPNNYLGYLQDLKNHYSQVPLIIAEFGTPSSWGNAHDSFSGISHGGLDETGQGNANARMLQNIYDTGNGGGFLFAWMDEWWKRTWIVDELTFPRDRFPIWLDITSPEQNFGLIAFDPDEPAMVKPALTTAPSGSLLVDLEAAANASFFTFQINLQRPLAAGESIVIGLDTYGDASGDSLLPNGKTTSKRAEFALQIDYPGTAQLYVAKAYNLYGIWHVTQNETTSDSLFHSVLSNAGEWVTVRWQNNSAHTNKIGVYYPEASQDIGALQVSSNQTAFASSRDAVILGNTFVKIRLPWTLLQFADPSTLSVMNDDRNTIPGSYTGARRETAISEGIALSVSFETELLETERFQWSAWDTTPTVTERDKSSFGIFATKVKELPDYLEE